MQKTQALIVNQQLTFGNKKELLLIWAQSNNFTEKAQILIVFFGHFTCVTNCSKRSMPVLYAPRHACVGMLTQLCPTLCNLYVACPAPLSMEFSSQEYWSELPFPPLGDLPNPGIKPTSPVSPVLAGGFFTPEPPGKLKKHIDIKHMSR